MKKIKFLVVAFLLALFFALTACNKDGKLDLKGILETGTPTPEDAGKEQMTSTPEPTEKPTEAPTPNPTVEPTAEPTAEPTEEPTPTEPEVTEEPTPTVVESRYADEKIAYEKPETIMLGAASLENKRYSDDETYRVLYDVSYDMLILGDEEKIKYPNLALGIDLVNMDFADMEKNAINRFEGFFSEGAEVPEHYYFSRVNYDILRADSYVVSVKEDDSVYEGGVHPESGVLGFSIDTETGEKLTISDICNDVGPLSTLIAYRLEEKYGLWDEEGNIEELISYIDGKIADGSQFFTVGYEGVTFYFTPYEIATFADGSLAVTISFEETIVGDTENGPELIGLFKKKFRTVPDNYMVTMSFGEEIELLDISEEKSEFSTLKICNIPSEEYEFESNGVYFLINNNEVLRMDEFSFYGDEAQINLVKKGNDRFIILRTVQDSDDTYTYLLKIYENGEIGCDPDRDIYDSVGFSIVPLRYVYGDGDWDYNYTRRTVCDPENIPVNFRFDVIGTNFVKASVRIDPQDEDFAFNGEFVIYEFTYKAPLTLKKDFKKGMIDPELTFGGNNITSGELDMEVELQAGDVIYLQKCTPDRQVFFSTDNGEWGTFKMDGGYDFSMTINGENVNDLFDGISYAD